MNTSYKVKQLLKELRDLETEQSQAMNGVEIRLFSQYLFTGGVPYLLTLTNPNGIKYQTYLSSEQMINLKSILNKIEIVGD